MLHFSVIYLGYVAVLGYLSLCILSIIGSSLLTDFIQLPRGLGKKIIHPLSLLLNFDSHFPYLPDKHKLGTVSSRRPGMEEYFESADYKVIG